MNEDTITGAPNWRPLTDTDLFERAHNLPTSYGRMLFEDIKQSAITSPGLTPIRELQTPPRAPVEAELPPEGPRVIGGVESPEAFARRRAREAVEAQRKEMGAITKEEYEASPSFRKDVPYDPGMTRDRAAAIAAWNDEAEYRKSLIARGPNTIFGYGLSGAGKFIGSALDPINYVPVVGQAVRAASVARFGVVGGTALAASADAAANTAIFGMLTRSERGSFGDDVSYQAMLGDVAMAALIGGAFGGAVGGYQRWQLNRSLQSLERVNAARVAVDDVAADLVHGRDPTLPPTVGELVARTAEDMRPEALRQTMEPMPGREEDGFIVFHGSLHDFNRFELSERTNLSGEGNNALGYGLYFGGAREVGEHYLHTFAARSLEDKNTLFDGKPFDSANPAHHAAEALHAHGGDRNAAISYLLEEIDRVKRVFGDAAAQEAVALDLLKSGKPLPKVEEPTPAQTYLYETRVKAKPEEFLDWDKPLSEQSEYVRAALKPLIDATLLKGEQQNLSRTAGGYYDFLSGLHREGGLGSPAKASEALRKAGVKGIAYLDGNSREAGKGTRNYLVFDDAILDIVSKNGQPIVAPEPKPEPPDPKEVKAAATIGKRPRDAAEEFGVKPLPPEQVDEPVVPPAETTAKPAGSLAERLNGAMRRPVLQHELAGEAAPVSPVQAQAAISDALSRLAARVKPDELDAKELSAFMLDQKGALWKIENEVDGHAVVFDDAVKRLGLPEDSEIASVAGVIVVRVSRMRSRLEAGIDIFADPTRSQMRTLGALRKSLGDNEVTIATWERSPALPEKAAAPAPPPQSKIGPLADDVSIEDMEFSQLRERGRLSAEDAAAYEQAVAIERQSAAYADGLVAAALCRTP